MTALEQQLTKALRALSAQYEQAQQQHAAQVEALAAASRAALRASNMLGRGLQDARRDVARGAGGDAPAWAGARSWSEPLMVPGSGMVLALKDRSCGGSARPSVLSSRRPGRLPNRPSGRACARTGPNARRPLPPCCEPHGPTRPRRLHAGRWNTRRTSP